MRGKIYYNVAPRYTSGSPGQVDKDTAMRVAEEERRSIDRLRNHPGLYGPEEDLRLEAYGEQGIVYSHAEIGRYIYVTDFLTKETFRVPVKEWSGHHWHSRKDRGTYKFGDVRGEAAEHFWGLTLHK